jgi:hypothetical protein
MGFGYIFSKSWKDYKANFKSIALAMLVLYFIGFFIVKLVSFVIISSSGYNVALEGVINGAFANGDVANLTQTMGSLGTQYASAFSQASLYSTILTIVAVLVYLIFVFGITSSYMKKDKFSFRDILTNGKSNYLICLGFIVVALLLLAGLYVLLIIPGIIFTIYWMLDLYAFYDDPKKRYIESLRSSYRLVKGRWWITLGYTILLLIIFVAIYLIFNIPSGVLAGISLAKMISGTYSSSFMAVVEWVGFIMQALANFVIVPLGIMFYRNLYREYKATKAN